MCDVLCICCVCVCALLLLLGVLVAAVSTLPRLSSHFTFWQWLLSPNFAIALYLFHSVFDAYFYHFVNIFLRWWWLWWLLSFFFLRRSVYVCMRTSTLTMPFFPRYLYRLSHGTTPRFFQTVATLLHIDTTTTMPVNMSIYHWDSSCALQLDW